VTSRAWSMIGLLAVAIVVGSALWIRCETGAPVVSAPEALAVGVEPRTVTLDISDRRSGLRHVRALLRHAGGEALLLEERLPGNLATGGEEEQPGPFELTLDARELGLREGAAFLEVEAVDWSWANLLSGNRTRVEIPVEVLLSPPRVHVETGLSYLTRAGTGAVAYVLDRPAERDGVEVGEHFFPGFPHPAPEAPAGQRRFVLFAISRDTEAQTPIRAVAVDRAGNRTARGWQTRVADRRFDDVRMNLSQRFLQEKIPELALAVGVREGSPLADFQRINTEVREANEARIRQIVTDTVPEQLWEGAFVQLRNSMVTSRFAEQRTYFVEGEQVSEAVHYGYDLASLAGAPIEAGNTGRVIFAGELGIYGDTVILDHGFGLSSLYSHLSRIDVEVGERVEKGDILGLTGQTGLAGGDHLHFAILVGGVYVDPVEWWDPKWVRERIDPQLEAP
jgi:murein DD-endopeptidase MepM/ murein hydrolase activator NlpD